MTRISRGWLAYGDPVCRAKEASSPFAGMTRIRFKGSPRCPERPSVSQPLVGTPLGRSQSSGIRRAMKAVSNHRLLAHFGDVGVGVTRLAQHLVGMLAQGRRRPLDRPAAMLEPEARTHDLDRAARGPDGLQDGAMRQHVALRGP